MVIGHATINLEEGMLLNSYRLKEFVGKGGMGVVFRGELLEDKFGLSAGEELAIKVFDPDLLADDSMFKRIQREAQVGERLDSNHIVKSYSLEETEFKGQPIYFMVMDFVRGTTLQTKCREKYLTIENCIDIVRQVCDALRAIHAIKIVHRDIKPENILIDDDGTAKVMDFGLARLTESHYSKISMGGAFIGTIDYASPEQFMGQEVDPRADLYALGAVIYEMLTGSPPFPFTDLAAKIGAITREAPRPPMLLNPDVPYWLEELTLSLLEKKPEDRPQSVEAVLERISQAESGTMELSEILPATWEMLGRVQELMDIDLTTEMMGREVLLKRLLGQLEGLQQGKGGAALIRGEAGVGKTRFIYELFSGLIEKNSETKVIFSPCLFHTVKAPLDTVYAAMRQLVGVDPTASQVSLAGSLAAELSGILPEHRETMLELAEAIIGDTGKQAALPVEKVYRICIDLLRTVSLMHPVVLAFDNLQWVDEVSLGFLSRLLNACHELPIFVILAMRDHDENLEADEELQASLEQMVEEGERQGNLTLVELPRLEPLEVEGIVTSILVKDHNSIRLARDLHRESGGVPYFVFECIDYLKDQGLVVEEEGLPTLSPAFEEVEIPHNISRLFSKRIEALETDELELLELAAIQGDQFEPKLLAEVAEEKYILILKKLRRLERQEGLIVSMREGGYRFEHHQYWDAIYKGISHDLREEYHLLYSEILRGKYEESQEPATALKLCRHLMEGGDYREALGVLPNVLDHLKSQGRLFEALGLTRQAEKVVDESTTERELAVGLIEVLTRRAGIFLLLANREGQYSALIDAQRIAERLDLKPEMAAIDNGLATYYRLGGEFELAFEKATSSKEIARANGLENEYSFALNAQGNIRYNQGRFEEALECYLEAQPVLEKTGSTARLGDIYCNIGISLAEIGRYEEAETYLEKSVRLAREAGLLDLEIHAKIQLGWLRVILGELAGAMEPLQEAVNASLKMGNRLLEGFARGIVGTLHRIRGELDAAEFYLNEAMAIFREASSFTLYLAQGLELIEIYLDKRDMMEFMRVREEIKPLMDRIGEAEQETRLTYHRARFRQLIGLNEEFDKVVAEMTAKLDTAGEARWVLEHRLYAGLMLLEARKVSEADSIFTGLREKVNIEGKGLLELRLKYFKTLLSIQDAIFDAEYSDALGEEVERAIDELNRVGMKREIFQLVLRSARAALAAGKLDRATLLLETMEREQSVQSWPGEYVELLRFKGDLLRQSGDPACTEEYQKASELFDRLSVSIPEGELRETFLSQPVVRQVREQAGA